MSKYTPAKRIVANSAQAMPLKVFARGRKMCRTLEALTFVCFLVFVASLVGAVAADVFHAGALPPALVGRMGEGWRMVGVLLLLVGLAWAYLESDFGLVDDRQERQLWALRQLMPQVDAVLADIAKQGRAVTRKEHLELVARYQPRAVKHALARHYEGSLT